MGLSDEDIDMLLDELANAQQRIAELEANTLTSALSEIDRMGEIRRKVAEDCASIVEDTDVVVYRGPYDSYDNGLKTLGDAARAIRAKFCIRSLTG